MTAMTPQSLALLAKNLQSAADIVDAIDDCRLQSQRGWDLRGWQYRLVPWGVCFVFDDPRSSARARARTLFRASS